MNSSPEITIVHHDTLPPPPANARQEKATVPEMNLLYHIIAEATINGNKLRAELQKCTPEERAFLHRLFIRAATK